MLRENALSTLYGIHTALRGFLPAGVGSVQSNSKGLSTKGAQQRTAMYSMGKLDDFVPVYKIERDPVF